METVAVPESNAAARSATRKQLIRLIAIFGWVGIIGFQGSTTRDDPNTANGVVFGVLVVLFFAVNAQLFLGQWLGSRRLSRAMTRLHGSAYLSELDNLPNRNYLLSELRREMPRARSSGVPFVLIILSMDTFEEITERRGAEFASRALRGLSQVLKRFTRTSDFIAHLSGTRFCVMLNECRYDDAFIYLQRVPGSIAVSDGHRMLEVPVTARIHQYDMENLYATDVLRDAEESQPLRRKEQQAFSGEAA